MGVLGIAMSTAASQLLGFAWYGPLFGSMWCRNSGRRREDIERSSKSKWIMVVPLLSKLGSSIIIAHLLKDHIGVKTVYDACRNGLAFSAVIVLYNASHSPFQGEGLPAYLINAGYDAICTVMTAALVTRY
ncbi:uncharacterized protein LOC129260374 [Lytechinus pictus]|uniref:uncharacterized protein LOC129260374 n=1 Tax=Lytechinus pictus TaxID=7653 RepID=UPI00240E0B4C|nr:uncharacterized protein LOC129260374 [Lytechinus pictus]